jgi:hypothetical protein
VPSRFVVVQGQVDVGKLADLILLDQNLFEIPPHEIHAARVVKGALQGGLRRPEVGGRIIMTISESYSRTSRVRRA